jgi:hypothetical protein
MSDVYDPEGYEMLDVHELEGSERLYMPNAIQEMLTALDNYEKTPSHENYDEVYKKSVIGYTLNKTKSQTK